MDQRAPPSQLEIPVKPARRRTRRTKRWTLKRVPGGRNTVIAAIAVLLIIGVVWAIKPGSRGHVAQQPPIPVGIATATSGNIAIHLNALGTVTPLATVTVRTQVTGVLASINFTEGQTVKTGDLLAQIDPRPFQAALDQAKGQLARDQASLSNARIDVERYKTLLAQDSISQQTYATQEALVGQDEGTVKSDQAMVETAAINLDFTRITSPVNGRVGLRQVDLGNLIQADNTTIVVVTQLQPISALFAVPEDSIGDITGRLNQGATLSAAAFDRSGSKQLATGTLATLDNEIDVTTGTVKLRAMFDNTDTALFPNQFVNIQLLVDTKQNQIIVPTAAIQRGASGPYVFLVNQDKTVKMTQVTLGPADGEQQAVAQGLKAGDAVVVDGADQLRDGSHVEVPANNGQQPNGQPNGQQPNAQQPNSPQPRPAPNAKQQAGQNPNAGGKGSRSSN